MMIKYTSTGGGELGNLPTGCKGQRGRENRGGRDFGSGDHTSDVFRTSAYRQLPQLLKEEKKIQSSIFFLSMREKKKPTFTISIMAYTQAVMSTRQRLLTRATAIAKRLAARGLHLHLSPTSAGLQHQYGARRTRFVHVTIVCGWVATGVLTGEEIWIFLGRCEHY